MLVGAVGESVDERVGVQEGVYDNTEVGRDVGKKEGVVGASKRVKMIKTINVHPL